MHHLVNYSQIMSPRPPLPRKVGGHDPPAPMGAPPLVIVDCNQSVIDTIFVHNGDFRLSHLQTAADLVNTLPKYYNNVLHAKIDL